MVSGTASCCDFGPIRNTQKLAAVLPSSERRLKSVDASGRRVGGRADVLLYQTSLYCFAVTPAFLTPDLQVQGPSAAATTF